MALRETPKVNTTLKQLKLSNNEIGMWEDDSVWNRKQHPTPEGPAALAEGLAANTSVTVVDVSNNNLGREGGKALAAGLKANTTITQVR